ncbi:MAG: hypothetical protein GFH23_1086750n39 [Chloroflexi bacterium AL-N1]|nr:hypothetical protein [Chloroflexi bacterium AL-N1]
MADDDVSLFGFWRDEEVSQSPHCPIDSLLRRAPPHRLVVSRLRQAQVSPEPPTPPLYCFPFLQHKVVRRLQTAATDMLGRLTAPSPRRVPPSTGSGEPRTPHSAALLLSILAAQGGTAVANRRDGYARTPHRPIAPSSHRLTASPLRRSTCSIGF